jgi:hypothetical protein
MSFADFDGWASAELLSDLLVRAGRLLQSREAWSSSIPLSGPDAPAFWARPEPAAIERQWLADHRFALGVQDAARCDLLEGADEADRDEIRAELRRRWPDIRDRIEAIDPDVQQSGAFSRDVTVAKVLRSWRPAAKQIARGIIEASKAHANQLSLPGASGSGNPWHTDPLRLPRLLAAGIWEHLQAKRQATKPAAVLVTLADDLARTGGASVQADERQLAFDIVASTGVRLATISADLAEGLAAVAEGRLGALATMDGWRCFNFLIREGHHQKLVNKTTELAIPGGYSGLAAAAGCHPTRGVRSVREWLLAANDFRWSIPGNAEGAGLLNFRCVRGGRGRQSVLHIQLAPWLLPGYVHEIAPGDKRQLVPLPAKLATSPQRKYAGRAVALQYKALVYCRRHCEELVREGWLQMPWDDLAAQCGVPRSALPGLLDMWCVADGWLERDDAHRVRPSKRHEPDVWRMLREAAQKSRAGRRNARRRQRGKRK